MDNLNNITKQTISNAFLVQCATSGDFRRPLSSRFEEKLLNVVLTQSFEILEEDRMVSLFTQVKIGFDVSVF